jgi:hypothetical protein
VTSYRTTSTILIPGETKVNVIVADIVQPQPKGLGWTLLNSLVYAASVPPVWKSKLFSTITYTLQDLSRPKSTNTVKHTVTSGYNYTLHFMFNIEVIISCTFLIKWWSDYLRHIRKHLNPSTAKNYGKSSLEFEFILFLCFIASILKFVVESYYFLNRSENSSLN